MAIVNGIMYAELPNRLYGHNSLNVIVVENHTPYEELRSHLDVLQAYIKDAGLDLSLKLSFVDFIKKDTAENDLIENDVDIVLIDEGVFTTEEESSLNDHSQILHATEDVLGEIGAFLVGNEIYWNFDHPVWNGSSSTRYTLGTGVAIAAQEFFHSINAMKLSSTLVARARYLWNKTIAVSYARDLLLYTLQLRRKANRRKCNDGWQIYGIEIDYHLTNFYFLMASTFDIISRFLNEHYSLGIAHDFKLALEKKTMLEKIKEPIPALYQYLSDPENNKWISWLKRRRNYIAHDGGVLHSPLIKEKATVLSDEEVATIVDSRRDWRLFEQLAPKEVCDMYRQIEEQQVRLENDYEIVVKDVMIIEGRKGKELSSPLISISYDYDSYSRIVGDILKIILSNLGVSSDSK